MPTFARDRSRRHARLAAEYPFDTEARREEAFETWTSEHGPCREGDCELPAAYPCGRCHEHAE